MNYNEDKQQYFKDWFKSGVIIQKDKLRLPDEDQVNCYKQNHQNKQADGKCQGHKYQDWVNMDWLDIVS